MNDKALEARINELRLNVPRVTLNQIENSITGETYTVLPSGKVVVCELTLTNGFTVRGESAVISVSNFSDGIGRRISRQRAVNQIWQLEDYLLQQKLYEAATADATAQG
jgi:hypothetical protein